MTKTNRGAPVGDRFTVGEGDDQKTYTVLPNVFSDATLEALTRLKKQKLREVRQELLGSLNGVADNVAEAMSREIVRASLEEVSINYDDAVSLIASGDGMATVLQVCCPEVNGDYGEARSVVRKAPNLLDLMQVITGVGAEALELAENSKPQKQTKKAERK